MHVHSLPYCVVIIVAAMKLYRSAQYACVHIRHFSLVVGQKKTALEQNKPAIFILKKFWKELIAYFDTMRTA
jgi:hypothetical protein